MTPVLYNRLKANLASALPEKQLSVKPLLFTPRGSKEMRLYCSPKICPARDREERRRSMPEPPGPPANVNPFISSQGPLLSMDLDLMEVLPLMTTMLGDSTVAFLPASLIKAIDVVPRFLLE